ncbi:MAG: hypothetical protein HFJ34_07515 [Clostridia bacterium]|nr:hypothetical protein [Clostridia bacterium]
MGIAIATLTGENGILNKAQQAGEKTQKAEIIEKAKLDIIEIQTENESGDITKVQLKNVLEKYFNDVPNPLPEDVSNLELQTKDEYGEYKIKVSDIWNGKLTQIVVPVFNPDTLEIGKDAKNKDKYGCKVSNYTVQTSQMTTNVWRLFYQDSNYTYLITDEGVGNYMPSDYYSNYTEVGTTGKRLNPMIGSLLENINAENVKTVAWLTDTSNEGM